MWYRPFKEARLQWDRGRVPRRVSSRSAFARRRTPSLQPVVYRQRESATTGRAGGMRKAPKRGQRVDALRNPEAAHIWSGSSEIRCVCASSSLCPASPAARAGPKDTETRLGVASRIMPLTLALYGGSSASPCVTTADLTRERQSLMSSHRQSRWISFDLGGTLISTRIPFRKCLPSELRDTSSLGLGKKLQDVRGC